MSLQVRYHQWIRELIVIEAAQAALSNESGGQRAWPMGTTFDGSRAWHAQVEA